LRLPPATTGQRIALALGALLAITVAWGVHVVVGWNEVARLVSTLPWSTWLAFTVLIAVSYAFRVIRVWRLLRDVHAEAMLVRTIPVFFVHNALATALPARLGDAAMPVLARRWIGADWAAAIGALAWWRLGDAAVVAALAIVLIATGAQVLAPLLVVAIGACIVPFAAFGLRRPLAQWLERRAACAPGSRALAVGLRVLRGMPQHPLALAADLALASVAWTAKIASFTVLIVGALPGTAGSSARWAQLAAAALAGDVAGALPVPTIGGIGPFEAGIVLGLAALDVAPAEALAVSVLVHGALLASIALTGLGGLVAAAVVEHERRAHRSA